MHSCRQRRYRLSRPHPRNHWLLKRERAQGREAVQALPRYSVECEDGTPAARDPRRATRYANPDPEYAHLTQSGVGGHAQKGTRFDP